MSQVHMIPVAWSDEDYVSPAELAAALRVSTKTLDNWAAAKRFPRPVMLGPRTRRYKVGTVRKALRKMDGDSNGSGQE